MIGNWLPVIDRELRLAVRRRSTYYGRVSAAAVVMTATLAMLYAGFGGWMGAAVAGRNLFVTLSILGYVYVLFDGFVRTADSISEEKREGTLGLLFLTDLRSGDIILGKLSSRILPAACNVVAGLPALGSSIFLGGITGPDLFWMMLVLLNGLFYASAFGMLISVICRSDRVAFLVGGGAMVLIGVGLPLIGFAVQAGTGGATIHPVFLVGTPGGALWELINSGTKVGSFKSALVGSHFVGWAMLLMAAVLLRFTWRESKQVLAFLWREVRLRPRRSTGRARVRGGEWLERQPLIWTGERNRMRLHTWLTLLGVVGLGWFAAWWFDLISVSAWATSIGFVLLLHFMVQAAVLVHVCRSPVEDRRSGVFELLCTTPLGPDLVVEGRQLSIKRQCLAPVCLVLVVDSIILVAGWWQLNFALSLAWTGLFVILWAKWLIDLYVVSWVGFWHGVRSRTGTAAIRRTIGDLFVWRWFLMLLFAAASGVLTSGTAFQLRPSAAIILGVAVYCGVTAATYLHFGALARSELKDLFRVMAGSSRDETAMRTASWGTRFRIWFHDWFWWIERRRSSDAL